MQMYMSEHQFGAKQHARDRSVFDYWKCAAIKMVCEKGKEKMAKTLSLLL